MNILTTLKKSIIGGFLIGFGGTVYLNMDNKIVAAFLFGLGLFTIINFELNLYTGKIGYLSKENWREILLTLIGNFIGTNLFAFLVLQTRLAGKLKEVVALLLVPFVYWYYKDLRLIYEKFSNYARFSVES